jgi:rhodanese-related sulfurtransferase
MYGTGPPYATGHPLFAANMAAQRDRAGSRSAAAAQDAPIVVYDKRRPCCRGRGSFLPRWDTPTFVRSTAGWGWKNAGFELFRTNSYAKAFVANWWIRRRHRHWRRKKSLTLIARRPTSVLDVRRFDEYATMNIPGSISVPGAELVLRVGRAAPDPDTTIIVNCAGRTRSIIGTQSLINAGVTNKVVALRNGTIGWTLARQDLEHGADRRGRIGAVEAVKANARDVAYRAGVRRVGMQELAALDAQTSRTLYRFDVRDAEEFAAAHIAGFRHYAGGQLVQEIDMAARCAARALCYQTISASVQT